MRKFKNLNVIRETDNEAIIGKLLEDGFEELEEEVKEEEVEEEEVEEEEVEEEEVKNTKK